MFETEDYIEAAKAHARSSGYTGDDVSAEVAAEILSFVAVSIMARRKRANKAEAERLRRIYHHMFKIRGTIRCENPEYNNALADKGGGLLKDKKALWAELNRLDNAPAEAAAQSGGSGAA